MPLGSSSSLLEAFSGLSRVFLGFLGPYLAFTKPEKARESPKKAWRRPQRHCETFQRFVDSSNRNRKCDSLGAHGGVAGLHAAAALRRLLLPPPPLLPGREVRDRPEGGAGHQHRHLPGRVGGMREEPIPLGILL